MTQLSTLASSWSSLTWHNPLWLHLVLQNHNETETDRAHIQHYRWTSRKKDFHFTFVALKKHWDHCAHSQEDYFKEDDKPLPFFSLTSLGIFLHHLKLLHIQSPKHLDKLYLMHIFTTNSIHLLLFFFLFSNWILNSLLQKLHDQWSWAFQNHPSVISVAAQMLWHHDLKITIFYHSMIQLLVLWYPHRK